MNDPAMAPAFMPLMMGLQDNRQVTVKAGPKGQPTYTFLGNSRVGTDLPSRCKQRLARVFFGPGIPIEVPGRLRGLPMVNSIGDPDMASVALKMLDEYVETNGLGCFNHPAAVLGSAREKVAEKLAGIPGMQVPRTLRARIEEPGDVTRLAEDRGLSWPLIVRVAGSHRGVSTVLVHAPAQVKQKMRELPWGGHDLYLTEYVDCRDADGHYRKARIVVVGREIFFRHLVIANEWLVHAHDRELGHLEEEMAVLRDFRSVLLPKIQDTMLAVADAVDMDYFGMDCSIRPDGRLLMFEANGLMDILLNTMASPNCWDQPIEEIRATLSDLMFEPSRWRHPPRQTAAP